ncbi:RNase H-like domain found in reverse transcriptase [Popillia japonica]|uniref:RNA-directed DNA polymerase n=1 Tax=Popillia japonica TaxID=7064 RepID=A0AAW1N3Y3_POPJA
MINISRPKSLGDLEELIDSIAERTETTYTAQQETPKNNEKAAVQKEPLNVESLTSDIANLMAELQEVLNPALLHNQANSGTSRFKDNILTLRGKIFNQPQEIVLDTGSSYNLISRTIAKEITPLETAPILVTVGSNVINVLGKSQIPITLKQRQFQIEALVVEKLPVPLLLGYNFMRDNGVIINFSNNSIDFPKIIEQVNSDSYKKFQKLFHYYTIDKPDNVTEIDADIFKVNDKYSLLQCVSADMKMAGGIAKTFKEKFNTVQDRSKQVGDITVTKVNDRCDEIKNRSSHASVQLLAAGTTPTFNIADELSPRQKEYLSNILNNNKDLMAWDSTKLGLTNLAEHEINTESAQPIRSKPYKVAPKERNIIHEQSGQYSIFGRFFGEECLSAVWAVQYFRSFLWGLEHFTIVTDHHSLCWLHSIKNPSSRLARWSLKLMEYNYTVQHKRGSKNGDVDALSRYPCEIATKAQEEEAINVPTFIATPADLVKCQENDIRIQELIQALKNPDSVSPALRRTSKNFEIVDDVLYKKNPNSVGQDKLLVIPHGLKHEILYSHHNEPLSGHLGMARTLNKIKKSYFWDGMTKDVKKYVRGCQDCQSRKGPTNVKPAGLLQPIPVGSPFEMVGIDLLGPFRRSSKGKTFGKTFIVVATDYATRWAEAKALTNGKAEGVAKFLLEQIICRHGVAKFLLEQIICRHGAPKKLLSDRGAVFQSQLVTELLRLMGTTNMISKYTSTSQKDWDECLPHVIFAYNTATQESTKYSPFELVYGREAVLPTQAELAVIPTTEYALKTREHILKIRAEAKLNIHQQQRKDKLFVWVELCESCSSMLAMEVVSAIALSAKDKRLVKV